MALGLCACAGTPDEPAIGLTAERRQQIEREIAERDAAIAAIQAERMEQIEHIRRKENEDRAAQEAAHRAEDLSRFCVGFAPRQLPAGTNIASFAEKMAQAEDLNPDIAPMMGQSLRKAGAMNDVQRFIEENRKRLEEAFPRPEEARKWAAAGVVLAGQHGWAHSDPEERIKRVRLLEQMAIWSEDGDPQNWPCYELIALPS